MASAEKVAAKWVVGPTEDVVQALMETLVEPLLPLRRVSIEPPSIDAQKSVSKQMHAVVLLYNYHHRKQKTELKFLDFQYFCQLAVVLRPPLIAFMKLFMESESMELNSTENQLSLTEKAIKDACDISMALDASRNVPNVEGWPISTVAVLLIDSKKENCFLQFGAVTKGTWSLIEIELNESNTNREISGEERVGDKRKRSGQKGSTDDTKYLQLGYDAVKEVTGINSSDLEVLETHVTYSSSKKNSAARFYMLQYNGSFNVKEQVPLETLVESLQGPLAEKLSHGFWRTTPVVEYHHMLPYVEFISCWLSGKDLCLPSPGRDLPLSKPELENIDNSRSRMEINSSNKIAKKDESVIFPDNKSDEFQKGPLSDHSTGLQKVNMRDFTETFSKNKEPSKKVNSIIKVYHHRRKNNSSTQHDARVQKDGVKVKVDMVDSLKSCDTQCRDEKLSADNGNITTLYNQSGIAVRSEQLVQFEAKTKYNVEVQSAPASEESHNALSLLYRKREEMCSKLCGMEDTLALYEDIIARIRDGGEVGLARQCIESILTGNDHLLSEHERRIGLSETYVPGKSSCQLENLSLAIALVTQILKMASNRENNEHAITRMEIQLYQGPSENNAHAITGMEIQLYQGPSDEQNVTLEPKTPNEEQQNSSRKRRFLTTSKVIETTEVFFRVFRFSQDDEKYLLEMHHVQTDYIDRYLLVLEKNKKDDKKFCVDISDLDTGAGMASAEKVAAKWVVGPTEDVVQALMETLVEPLLPLRRVSIEPPSIDAQKSVSKQMHAVVLLYNYHHRKQKTELKFLDFQYFCQLAVVLRPPLIAFMKLFKESESMELNSTENQLSLTEKAIKDACDISMALDASRNVPNVEGWPISTVAVLLIDSKKENCFLQFGAVTKGTWSLIEIELNESNTNREISGEERVGDKRKRSGQKGSTDDTKYLQLGYDAVKEVTGINSSDLEVLETHVTYSSSKKNSTARFYMLQYNGSFNVKEQVPLETLVESLQGPLAEKLSHGFWRTMPVVEYHHMLPYVEFISCWLSGKDLCLPSPGRDLPLSKPELENIDNSSSRMEINSSNKIAKKDESVIFPDNKSDEFQKGPLSDHSMGLQKVNMRDFTETFSKNKEPSKKVNSIIKVYHHRRKNNSSTQHDARVQKDGVKVKVDMVDSLKSCDTQCRDEKLSADNGNITTLYNQSGIAVRSEQLVQFEAKTKYNVEVQSAPASEESHNALSLLYRKREEMCSKLCGMEDTLALYEDIIARIRDGGEVGLARQCIESILTGNDHLLSEHERRIGLSETYVPGKSSCQDLEYICLKNNWRQPRYLTEPSVGKFVSNVVVGRKDFKLSSTGGSETKPCEARESAAANMISKLRNSCI
ncbi:hypothetical protein BUALT_Bualt19G0004500 [Buddleja alternifolia]|uniref:DRBM domain-containing protein n=1 Tax=Buddleja alternifolia TaxID=168488 RepID=A0AAV6W0K7_9LAMI|nr:hypothetical protein BUALT_Bualt19G0004500 [Buddleja alternifolia]